jgi:L-seryl-tRNA(Ser) seleniumtransferase
LKDEAEREIPVWRMLSTSLEQIRLRAQAWAQVLDQGLVVPGESTVGGGSLPGETMPTWLLSLAVRSPNRSLARLRQAIPPIIARLENDRLVLDPRTILPEQDQPLLAGLKACL